MYYIYGIVNINNQKWYIGQTTQKVNLRYRQHIRSSQNPNSDEYNCLFSRALRKYGEDSFKLHVLEKVENFEDLDKKEIKWISVKKSYVRDGGYNSTRGGQINRTHSGKYYEDARQVFTDEATLLKIISEIKEEDSNLTKIANKYDVSVALISLINTGDKYRREGLIYPLKTFRKYPTEEDIKNIVSLLKQGFSNIDISQKLSLSSNIVSRINQGHAYKLDNEKYPLRKTRDEREIRALKIKELLEKGGLNNKQIAEQVGVDPSVVSRINSGKAYKEKDRKYPIR